MPFYFRQIHMILAQGLYAGSQNIKSLILRMASSTLFPIDLISTTMSELQSVVHLEAPSNNTNQHIPESLCYPIMSIAQTERLEELMHKLKVNQIYLMNVPF